MIEGLQLLRSTVPRGFKPQYNVLSAYSRARYQPVTHRPYATETSLGTTGSPSPRPHKRVTVFNDDGHVRWGDLSPAEKIARTTQQSVNFGLVIGGAILTAAVFTLLYTDVFSPQSSVSHFNRAVDRIRVDQRCIDLLGPSKEITAYGEPSWNKWRRNRPIASRTETDKFGTEKLYMHFNISGPLNDGVAHLYMVRRKDEREFNYGYLAVDVRGNERVYLENADAAGNTTVKSKPGTILGIRFW